MEKNQYNTSLPAVGLLNLSIKKNKKKNNCDNLKMYNTCYINSSIQCLFHLDKFINKIVNCSIEGNLTKATKNLIYNMKNNNQYLKLSVSEIKETMVDLDEKYNDNQQEDANEFISDYLNLLIEETRIKNDNLMNSINFNNFKYEEAYFHFINKFYKKGSSFISELFEGILRTENFCKICKSTFSIKYHPFNILNLPLCNLITKYKKKPLEMSDIFEQFILQKKISNKICSKCEKEIYTKTDIYKFPYYLILYFERNDGNYYIENKINDLNQINLTNFLYKKDNLENINYNLKGVIYYYSFDKKSGHYSASSLINNRWYYFDDDYIEDSEKMAECKNENIIIAFYEKNN